MKGQGRGDGRGRKERKMKGGKMTCGMRKGEYS